MYGFAIILVILLAPEGIYWRVRDALTRPKSTAAAAGGSQAGGSAAFAAVTGEVRVLPVEAPTRPPAAGTPAILELRGVTKSFGGLCALDGVSFTVPRGTLQGIIGPNGSGKTTLFNVLNGFLAPDRGSILFQGQNIVGLKPNRVCRLGVGRTFQVVRTFARMTVLQNAMVGAFVHSRDDEIAGRAALEALERVGLADRSGILAGLLTNKERRLMELARALASKPDLILMDETLAGLASRETDELLGQLRLLNSEGLTILIIEHTLHAMLRLAHDFIVLDHGRMIAQGKPDAVVQIPEVIEAYLGKKWMNRVAH